MSEFQRARLNSILKPGQQCYLKRLILDSFDVDYIGYNVLLNRVLAKIQTDKGSDVEECMSTAIATKKSLRYLLFAMEADKEIAVIKDSVSPYVQFSLVTPTF